MPQIFRKPDPLPHRRQVLLIGAPRSGTTLLATMVGRHTDVGMLNEDVSGRGIRIIVGKQVTGNKLCIPNQIALTQRNFFSRRFLKKLGFVAEAPKSRYCIRDYLELPNLKILAIVRDRHDSVASMMARGKTKLKRAVRRWSEAIETIYELKQQYGERVMVVAFDDLLLQPGTVLEKVCAYLGITFQEQMLDGSQHNPYYPEGTLKTEKAHQSKPENAGSPLSALTRPADGKYQELLAQVRRDLR